MTDLDAVAATSPLAKPGMVECHIEPESPRTCERGVQHCVVTHWAPMPSEPCPTCGVGLGELAELRRDAGRLRELLTLCYEEFRAGEWDAPFLGAVEAAIEQERKHAK